MTRMRLAFIVSGAAVSLSILVNVLQARRIQALEIEIEDMLSRGGLAPGTHVSAIAAKDLAGREKLVDYSSSLNPTVLYVFRPSCVWCQRNSAGIKHLATRLAPKFRVIGLSLSSEGLNDFVNEHEIGFPVMADIPPSSISDLKLGTTQKLSWYRAKGLS